jgi:2-phosphoglycerate kinase
MRSVFIAGSRRFALEIKELFELCKKNRIKATTGGKILNRKDTFKSERDALLRAFRNIDKSNIVYVISSKGYVGRTVALEIAYAFSKNKEIISSEIIEDFSARALVSRIMNQKELIRYAKNNGL